MNPDQSQLQPNNPNQVSTANPPRAGDAGQNAPIDLGPETDLWKGRTSWMHYSGRMAIWFVVVVVAGVLLFMNSGEGKSMTFGTAFLVWVLTVLVSALIVIGKVALVVIGTNYRLTTQRLFIERGILSKTVDQTELMRVDDVRLHKSVMDRIFGLGSVAIVSTDATDKQIVVPGISDSDKVSESIRSRMRKLRQKTLFVEQL